MATVSAGILLYRFQKGDVQVFLVHPGGPLWSGKDLGAWSIAKGLIDQNETALAAAQREFEEETGCSVSGPFIPLAPVKQKSGKLIHAWAAEGDCDQSLISSNTFTMEWPPRSGMQQEFPEVDRAAWFSIEEAREKINPGQAVLLEELQRMVSLNRRHT